MAGTSLLNSVTATEVTCPIIYQVLHNSGSSAVNLMWLHHHGHCQFMADPCIYPYSTGIYPGLCHQFRSWGRHQKETFLALPWPFVCVVHRWRSPVHSPYKGQRHGALMFTLMWTWANWWTNNEGASGWDDIMSIWRHCSMHTNCCSVLETDLFFINLAMLDVSKHHGCRCTCDYLTTIFFYSDKQTQICLRIPIFITLPNK